MRPGGGVGEAGEGVPGVWGWEEGWGRHPGYFPSIL